MLIDMVMNFFTAIDVNEERVYRLKDIFINYVCGHFIIDAIVTLPGLVTFEQYGSIYFLKLLRFLQIGRFFK